jgi:uncharacterized membrane-anchored protein YjiN (DUF445 family)
MRLVATGLLVLMLTVFLIARRYEWMHWSIGYLRAFAEAATVGAFADWFAVTALFRRPLGLPFPHTAIIPRSKDRIGEGLGHFLESNFLSPALLGERLAKTDLLGEFAHWMDQPERARSLASAAAEGLPRLLDLVDDKPVEEALKAFGSERLRQIDLPTALANVLTFLTAEGRHRGVLDHLIRAADSLLTDWEEDIRARVRVESGALARLLGFDKRAADGLIGAARSAIREMATDPECELRRKLDEQLVKLSEDLRASPTLRAEVEAMKERMLNHPDVQAAAGAIWKVVKSDLQAMSKRADDALSAPLARALQGFAQTVKTNEDLRTLLNERVSDWLVRLASSRGGDVSRFVSEVIQSWDARTIIDRIEEGVGADLQYIRISGTLIGGSVGVILHLLTSVMY